MFDSYRTHRLAALLFILGSAASASAQTFTNPHPIAIPDAGANGVGSAAPSVITVPAGVANGGKVRHLTVTLHGMQHMRGQDLDILLVPPAASGKDAILLMSDADTGQLTGADLRFTDISLLAVQAPIGFDALHPTNLDGGDPDTFPAVNFSYTLTSELGWYRDMDPAGDWRLYAVDDTTGEVGSIDGGWSLDFTLSHWRTTPDVITLASPASAGTLQAGNPIPSTVTFSGLQGHLRGLRILFTMKHDRPRDIELLLKGPSGRCVYLMSDTGGSLPINNWNLAFEWSDEEFEPISSVGPMPQGTVAPTNVGFAQEADFTSAETGCVSTFTDFETAFAQAPINGTWSLYAADDAPGADGSIDSWLLWLDTALAPPILSIKDPVVDSTTIPGKPAITTLGGTVAAGDSPLASIRWRVRTKTVGTGIVDGYVEGPWQTLAPAATTWTLPDVPLLLGYGEIFVDVRDTADNVVTKHIDYVTPALQYTLAEGATGPFFDLDVTIFNPNDTSVDADVTFLTPTGSTVKQTHTLAAHHRLRIPVDTIAGLEQAEVSTIVTPKTQSPLVVERTMFWGDSHYGGHSANAIEPSRVWLFAEGAQGFFRTYLLLANPTGVDAGVIVAFNFEGNPTPHLVPMLLKAHARQTLDLSTIPELAFQSFGIVVAAMVPITAERSMYFSNSGRLFEGGHESTGVPEAQTTWLLAEGATGEFFKTFILAMNPGPKDADVTMTYLTTDGEVITKTHALPKQGRLSINVEDEDPRLKYAAFSTVVDANEEIVVERAMYWPGAPTQWTETHASPGLTELGLSWGVADVRIGGPEKFATYILLANTSDQSANIDVLFVRDDGVEVTRQVTVAAHSRYTIDTDAAVGEAWNHRATLSARITSTNGVPIAVERATYWNADGTFWAGGASAPGTKLQ